MKRDGGAAAAVARVGGKPNFKLNLRDLLMQLSTLVSAVVALESAPASATLNRRCSGGGGCGGCGGGVCVFRPR